MASPRSSTICVCCSASASARSSRHPQVLATSPASLSKPCTRELHRDRRRVERREAEAQPVRARELAGEGDAVRREQLLAAFRRLPPLDHHRVIVPLQANRPMEGVFLEAEEPRTTNVRVARDRHWTTSGPGPGHPDRTSCVAISSNAIVLDPSLAQVVLRCPVHQALEPTRQRPAKQAWSPARRLEMPRLLSGRLGPLLATS